MLEEIIENYPDETFLVADGFDGAIIGVCEDLPMRLIYSVSICLEIPVKEGMDEMDAIEHFDFNVRGGYVGEKTPIWCVDNF